MNNNLEILRDQLDAGCKNLEQAKQLALCVEMAVNELMRNTKGSLTMYHQKVRHRLGDVFFKVENLGNTTGNDGVESMGLEVLLYSQPEIGDVVCWVDIKENGIVEVSIRLLNHPTNIHSGLYPISVSYSYYGMGKSYAEPSAIVNRVQESKKTARSYYAQKGRERKERRSNATSTKELGEGLKVTTLRLGK